MYYYQKNCWLENHQRAEMFLLASNTHQVWVSGWVVYEVKDWVRLSLLASGHLPEEQKG